MKRLLLLLFVLTSPLVGFAQADTLSTSARAHHTRVQLVSEVLSAAPGAEFTLALRVVADDSWHSYWENPGDAGQPTRIKWRNPEGFEVGDIRYPSPLQIPFKGLLSYGYSSETILLMSARVANDFVGDVANLIADIRWVVCDDKVCVPEKATLELAIPIGTTVADQSVKTLLAGAGSVLPAEQNWPSRFWPSADKVTFEVTLPDDVPEFESLYLYPSTRGLIKYSEPQTFVRNGNSLLISAVKNRMADKKQAANFLLEFKASADVPSSFVALSAVRSEIALAPVVPGNTGESAASGQLQSGFTFTKALLFALLGGVLLNLMPCVFPVLSLKALSLVKLSNEDRSEARTSGLYYTYGILFTFLVFAAVILAFRAAGSAVGWGFHMQSPPIVLALGLMLVVIGLNLFGVFEISSRLSGAGQSLTQGSTRKSAFFTGLLAVLVATPCSAPFMAGALGYALSSGQSAMVIILVFMALGLGLALPYLMLSFTPGLQKALPKPGAWMVTFRQVLAFPMLASALWLFWVFGRQTGINVMAAALVVALVLSFGIWLYALPSSKKTISYKKVFGLLTIFAALWGAVVTLDSVSQSSQQENVASEALFDESPYSDQLVSEYLQQDKAVFAYFTADWCITCKVNERAALKRPKTSEAFAKSDTVVLVGDWTSQDSKIASILARYGRVGVPLYLYFPKGGKLENPVILPQVLTQSMLIDLADS